MQNQYPHVIKSPKPKQSNAWRSDSVPNVYKNLSHRLNHFKSSLSGDIETNPGPVINSTKTIQAPYSQDNVAMSGLNAGTQCVAMSLASLIYNKKISIVSSMDLVNIMNIGNELYSGLSSRIMCTIGGLGRHIGRQSTDISVDYRPTIDRLSTAYRSIVDR